MFLATTTSVYGFYHMILELFTLSSFSTFGTLKVAMLDMLAFSTTDGMTSFDIHR